MQSWMLDWWVHKGSTAENNTTSAQFPWSVRAFVVENLKKLLCFELVTFNKEMGKYKQNSSSNSSLYIHIFWITELWTRLFFFSFWRKGKHGCFQLIVFSVIELYFHIELQPAVHYTWNFFYIYIRNWINELSTFYSLFWDQMHAMILSLLQKLQCSKLEMELVLHGKETESWSSWKWGFK